jgi:Copper type II ascorbate-dependent monooxygenase, C-terminal domain
MRNQLALTAVLLGIASSFGCGSDDKGEPDTNNSSRDQGEEGCKPGETRCIDSKGAALCPANTGFPGDGYALCAPASEQEGLLLRYGPQSVNGAPPTPEEVAKYVIQPGAEEENCVYVRSTNTQDMYVNAYSGRMRPNSHHLIVTMVPEERAEGIVLNTPVPCDQSEALGDTWLLGSQDPQIDVFVEGTTQGADKAKPGDPEFGAGQLIKANQVMRIDAHYINPTNQPILREAWIYLRAVPKEKVLQTVDMITFFQTAISIPPNSTGTVTQRGTCKAPTDRNVALLTGHFHEHGTRFTIWWNKSDGTSEEVYNTFDWDTPGNGFYNYRVRNPSIESMGIWGARSGYINMKAGESLSFECQFDNPSDQTVRLGELGKDQMCNVFGLYYPTDGNQWRCECVGQLCI